MVIGVDFDTRKATLCAIPFDRLEPFWAEARWRKPSETGEDSAIRALDNVDGVLREAMLGFFRAEARTVVFIERGFGMSRRADWILGAYFGAIWSSLNRLALAGDGLNAMEAREWKRAVTKYAGIGLTKKGEGNANAKKEIANEATSVIIEQLALPRHGYVLPDRSLSPDELDAFAIAFCGRQLNAAAVKAA